MGACKKNDHVHLKSVIIDVKSVVDVTDRSDMGVGTPRSGAAAAIQKVWVLYYLSRPTVFSTAVYSSSLLYTTGKRIVSGEWYGPALASSCILYR